jgi:hypothetical protein
MRIVTGELSIEVEPLSGDPVEIPGAAPQVIIAQPHSGANR